MRPRFAAAALTLLLVGGGLAAALSARDQLHPKRFAAVEPGFLYRSGEIAPRLIRDVLEDNGIRTVVWMLHYDASNESHRAEKAAIHALDVRQVNLSLRGDGTGKVERYVDAVAEVADARRRGEAVLVQCAGGARRSGAVVAVYRLLVEGVPAEEAYRELDRFGSRPVAETPLLEYLNLHIGEIADLLVERGVLERAPDPLPLLRPPPETGTWARLSRRLREWDDAP
jgi:protein tyrosine/serine phosphatase